MKRAMAIAALGILLSACGQKGPLYLPDGGSSSLTPNHTNVDGGISR